MSTSTSFVLSSASSSNTLLLPESPSLSLLPFSLGPNSSPYATTSTNLSNYFQPRPFTNPNDDKNDNTKVQASFRGRTVIGQYIDLPKGYKGLILKTGKRPDKGGIEIHSENSLNTIKSSKLIYNSNSVQPKVDSIGNNEYDQDIQLKRTTRQNSGKVRGAGQIALSKPKTRQSNNRQMETKKRFRLDSDEDEEDDEEDEDRKPSSLLSRTPSKRSKNNSSSSAPAAGPSYTTPKKPNFGINPTFTNISGVDTPIPEIVIQEATPLKNPLPTPKKRLNQRRSSPSPSCRKLPEVTESMDLVEDQIQIETQAERYESPSSSADSDINGSQISNLVQIEEKNRKEDLNTDTDIDIQSDTKIQINEVVNEEDLIPSPSTENDLPSFVISSSSSSSSILNINPKTDIDDKENQNQNQNQNESYDGPIRRLEPISTFNGFMLYTPDDPLIGFRSNESSEPEHSKVDKEDDMIIVNAEEGSNTTENTGPSKETNIQVRKSWWRLGGAGEGGDEFIRGLGEYLGLCEILNEPVYLDDINDADDDADDDTDDG
ncbi:uncharacterized protein L201_000241 [Kwoniella dendrophila CBS 6074]|uniref:Uncharacterized protein n=1 Tax=Kwoniella dendrophila CBS 6074 TaxID=1295534 RepID=A0AAX4JLV3_9TREE